MVSFYYPRFTNSKILDGEVVAAIIIISLHYLDDRYKLI